MTTSPARSTAGGVSPFPSPASILDDTILPALTLAQSGVTGIGIPGVEGAINGVLELAMMLSTMKANKEDLAKLEKSLHKLITIDTAGVGANLKQRLDTLSSELKMIDFERKSLAEKSRFQRFLRSKQYKEKIQGIKDSVASHILHFTFYGNISIEKCVEDMASKVQAVGSKMDTVRINEVLSKLKCVPARYNSVNTPDRCMDGTRVDILKDIVTRLSAVPNSAERVVMLSGLAGSGKSTIAKTVAAILAEKHGILAASFFFSRDYTERKEITHLPTTLAMHLADYDVAFRTGLIDLLETDQTGILDAEPHLQFQRMIVEILEKLPPSSKPWAICLDALDECGKDRGQTFLRWLSDSIARIPDYIRFFLTGRPDIPSYLELDTLVSVTHRIVLDNIDIRIVTSDIYRYVEQSLNGANWTTRHHWKIQNHHIQEVTNRASGLFVFAATAVRYVIGGLPQVPPQESLEYLLGGEILTDLHGLYLRIVDEAIPAPAPGDRRSQAVYDRAMKILSTILQLFEPLDSPSLAALLGLDAEVLHGILLPLSAVIHVSHTPGVAIKIIHLSFREFMTSHVCHTNQIYSVAFSPDGKYIVSGSYDGTVRIWDAESGVPLGKPLEGHHDGVTSVSYSPDGKHIVSGSYDCTVCVWDAETGAALHGLLEGHTDVVLSVVFSPDGKLIVSGSGDNTMHVWDAETGAARYKLFERHISQVQFTSSSVTKQHMEKWPATITILAGHTHQVYSVAFSPDGKHIVSGAYDRTIQIWDAESGVPLGEPLEGHTDGVTSVSYSPNGKHIVSGSYDHTVRIWDAKTGAALCGPLEGHTDIVLSVAFSPDGKLIISGSGDHTARVWDAETGATWGGPFEGHTKAVISVAFSPDGKHVISGSNDCTLQIWDADSGAPLGQPLTGHTNGVYSVAFSPDGKHIASGSYDHTVRIWHAESGVAVGEPLEGHTDEVTSVTFSPDGKHIVSGSYDHTVRMWDAATGAALSGPLEGHTDVVNSVAFSPDGKYIVSGSDDYTLRVWDAKTWGAQTRGAQHGPLKGHTTGMHSIAFSPDGRHIVSGSKDHTMQMWDAESGAPLGKPLEGHTGIVYSVAFSLDGQHIVSGSHDHTIRIWDAKTGAALGGPLKGHTEMVNSVAFSPDGRYIVSGSNDHTVRVWDVKTRAAQGVPLEEHTASVHSVAFSPDGKHIISGSSDRTIRVWDVMSVLNQSSVLPGTSAPSGRNLLNVNPIFMHPSAFV
ncbi:WD-REPEATS-REGION domain-containing protein [Mycena venus]|uniref:WD-REPEATS-REGION domain-containing protein n=1 Tax=Mycena venus TaxID=2733690 RepID=A0A8H6YQW9_9AGAR|nr:WD-REPEATS-REGION domain-containing protein [Mycena venus]